MKLPPSRLILLLPGLFAGCGEPQADISTPRTHRSGAITFDYPGNWKISDELVTPEIHSLFVETPGDAIVIFQSYPTEEAEDLPTFTKAFSSSAATGTPIGMIVGSTFSDITEADGYEWIVEDFNINLLGVSVPHRRLYGSKMIGERQAFLIFQVAIEDSAKAEAGFHLIRNSLRGVQPAEEDRGGQPDTRSEPR